LQKKQKLNNLKNC